ncbi:MAG: hypothetical protein NC203_04945 [Firmicutes bacterium]|nr:hypothetical protein [[Eubacterium] siraeum]MCM1487697.1 hypothetical protein [Bacillota bacterium]
MKKQLYGYIERVQKQLKDGGDLRELKESMNMNIGFFQHERLIHLIITMTFAVMTVLSLSMTLQQVYLLPLFVLILALTVPYVFHYYFLENGVQKLQRLYNELEERLREQEK